MDTNEIWKNYENLTEPYNYITTICLNYANPACVPEGFTQLSITALAPSKPFESVEEDEYLALKRRLASEMMESCIKITGVDFCPHITEIEVPTPMTISHYTGAWRGNIYGFSHSVGDHAVTRPGMKAEDHFIRGLEFACACGMSGNGMGPAVTNGRAAIAGASPVPDPRDHIRELADLLHPDPMPLTVTELRQTSPHAKTFRFESAGGQLQKRAGGHRGPVPGCEGGPHPVRRAGLVVQKARSRSDPRAGFLRGVVVVLDGRQPAFVLRLVPQKSCSRS